jgi:Glycosyltransferase family 87
MAVSAQPALGSRGLAQATIRVGSLVAFAVVPAVLALAILTASLVRGPFLYDFKGGLYGAGQAILHGRDPYRASFLAHQAAIKRSGGKPETVISVPVYPAPALVTATPLALLPYRIAGLLFVACSAAGLGLALWLLGVRDWRCYGVAFGSWPVMHGLMLGALTPLLVLGVAVAWRLREGMASAAVVASVVVAKLFPWPLAVWLALTRRWRAALVAVALAAGGTLAAWAAIGFAGFSSYPRMLGNLAFVSQGVSVSLVAGLLALGLGAFAAKTVALLLGLGLLAAAARLVRGPEGERRAFSLAIVAALVASPLVWPHYLALLIVPIALASPYLSSLWLVPLLAYIAPVAQTTGRPWAIVPYVAMCAIVAWDAMRPHPRLAI